MGVNVTIEISDAAAAALTGRAADAGESLAEYAAGIVERTADGPRPLSQISGPAADDFRQSGMTDDELGDLLEDAKHRSRRDRGRVGKP